MQLYTILFVLPTVIYASIEITIKAGEDEISGDIDYHGSIVEILPEEEREAWSLQDKQLKEAVASYAGREPDYAFLKGPTPWGDLYAINNWAQVQRTLKPVKARVLNVTTEPYTANTEVIAYKENEEAYNANIREEVNEIITSTWRMNGELSNSEDHIVYLVEFPGQESSNFTFTGTWGKEINQSKAVNISAEVVDMLLRLKPGQALNETLSATKVTMEIEIKYRATLDGFTAVNYKHNGGHHYWHYDINQCLLAADLPTTIDSIEIIKIEFYTDGKVTITDQNTEKDLLKAQAKIGN